jgi:hypothetical protein
VRFCQDGYLTPPASVGDDCRVARKLDPRVRKAIQELGRQGGLIGGKARARKLSAEVRREIARKAARVRWAKAKKSG